MNTRTGYELIDSGDQQKLERFGDFVLARPSAQAVWRRRAPKLWARVDATFLRDSSGTGTWKGRLPESWTMEHAGFTWTLRPNPHGNVGIFPEQESCWQWIGARVTAAHGAAAARSEARLDVLNLFAYTGGSTLVAARAGAQLVHVDASKTSVRQARENADHSGLGQAPIRWIAEDAVRFVEREIRRGNRYHGIVLDPPTFGRGTRGETWQIEEHMLPLLERCGELMAQQPAFFLLTSHSPGFTPLVLRNLVEALAPEAARVECGEMTVVDGDGRPLPSGAHARWSVPR